MSVDSGCVSLSILRELKRFHGQEVYKEIGTAVARHRKSLGLLLRLIDVGGRIWIFNVFFVMGAILCLRYFRLPDRDGVVFQYGVSRNNEVAFDKLNLCLHDAAKGNVVMNGRVPRLIEILRAAFSLRVIFSSAKMLANNHHQNPFVQLQMVIGMSAFAFYSACPLPSSFRVLCVANDHAPVPLALTRLCRARGLKTVYIQHAPVTEYFPPLSSDLSILYDEKSFYAYKEAARKRGELIESVVLFMPPFDERFVSPATNRYETYSVGFCLSKVPNIANVRRLLFSLCECEKVKSIVLRPHPASRADLSSLVIDDKVSLQEKYTPLKEFSSEISLALVPNSGVAIELLHKGIPTYYVSGTDGVAEDYYGFVEDGVLPVFDVAKFSKEGVDYGFYDKNWEKRFARYDGTVDKCVEDFLEEVADAFVGLM